MQRMPKGNSTKIVIRSTRDISEKKFACDACDRKFFTKKDAKRHMVVHTGNRDFVCSRCPQRFGRKDHLVRHVKKSHSGSLRKTPSTAAFSTLGAAVAAFLPAAKGTLPMSPKHVANASLKQEPGSYVVSHLEAERDLQVPAMKRVASPGSVIAVSAGLEEGRESIGDCHNLSGLTASAVNVHESNLLSPNSFHLSSEPDMVLAEAQVPGLSLLPPEMDAITGHVGYDYAEEARKLRMAQLQSVLLDQDAGLGTPASSPVSNIHAKLIRQSGGFVVEAAGLLDSPGTSQDCDGENVKREDDGEFQPDGYRAAGVFFNPATPVDSMTIDAELFVKQDNFLNDLIDEVDPDDYVNTVVDEQHRAKILSEQGSPTEMASNNGNSWDGFESSAYGASKEQHLLESRMLELLNNNPLCIPADATSMLTYLCDLAAESIAMDDSQSSGPSDTSSSASFVSDCFNESELPLSSVEKELIDFNQLLEQVCQEEACASLEHVTAAESSFATENVTADKPNPGFDRVQTDWLLMGQANASSLLFAARENQAAESWFCGRGEMSAEKCFHGCDAGPNELDQMPAWLYQSWKAF